MKSLSRANRGPGDAEKCDRSWPLVHLPPVWRQRGAKVDFCVCVSGVVWVVEQGVVACLAILAGTGSSGYTELSNPALPSQGQPGGKRWSGRAVAGQTDGACYRIFLYRKWNPLVV